MLRFHKMQTQINVEEGKIIVAGPYSELNNARWRELGGKFTGGNWVLPDTSTAREVVAELFGAKSEEVEVLVPAAKANGYQIVQVGGYVLAQRRERDYRVQMPDGVSLEAGRFSSSGGSRKSPSVGLTTDMVFRLRCRRTFAEAHGLQVAQTPAAGASIEV